MVLQPIGATSRKNKNKRNGKQNKSQPLPLQRNMVLVPVPRRRWQRNDPGRAHMTFQRRPDTSGTQVLHFDQIIGEFSPKLGSDSVEYSDVLILSPGFWSNRVGVIARSYGNYRFEELHIAFNSVASTLLSGSVTFGVQNYGNITFDPKQIVGTNGGVQAKISESVVTDIDLSAFNAVKAYPMQFDPNLQLGLVIVGSVSSDGTGLTHMPGTLGYFRIYGTVRLMNPGIISKRYVTKRSTLLTEATNYKSSVSTGLAVLGEVKSSLVSVLQELTVKGSHGNSIGSFFSKLLKKGAVILKEVGENAVKFLINRVATEFTAQDLNALKEFKDKPEDVEVRVYGTLPDEEQPGVDQLPDYYYAGEYSLLDPAAQKPSGLVLVINKTGQIGYTETPEDFPDHYVVLMGDNFSLSGKWTFVKMPPEQYLNPVNREEAIDMFIQMGIPNAFFYPSAAKYQLGLPAFSRLSPSAQLVYPADESNTVSAPEVSGPFKVYNNRGQMHAVPDDPADFKTAMVANGVVESTYFSNTYTMNITVGPALSRSAGKEMKMPYSSFTSYWKDDIPYELNKYIYTDSSPSEVMDPLVFFNVYQVISYCYGVKLKMAGSIYWAMIYPLVRDYEDNKHHTYNTKLLGLMNHILKTIRSGAPHSFIQGILDEGKATDYELDFDVSKFSTIIVRSSKFIAHAAAKPDIDTNVDVPLGISSLLTLVEMVQPMNADNLVSLLDPFSYFE